MHNVKRIVVWEYFSRLGRCNHRRGPSAQTITITELHPEVGFFPFGSRASSLILVWFYLGFHSAPHSVIILDPFLAIWPAGHSTIDIRYLVEGYQSNTL